jgi:hypothetical protein
MTDQINGVSLMAVLQCGDLVHQPPRSIAESSGGDGEVIDSEINGQLNEI